VGVEGQKDVCCSLLQFVAIFGTATFVSQPVKGDEVVNVALLRLLQRISSYILLD
jgi:hypothetical protein